MNFPIQELPVAGFPKRLLEIPQPPKQLNYRGTLPHPEIKLLSIVGSRKYTSYGKQVVDELVAGLAGHQIGIASGLALGIDSLAHEAALRNNLYTLAIPGGGIDDSVIYPATHRRLAQRILEAGGGLLSEYEPDFQATKWSFPQRNRLVAGISHATLLIEAGEKSGTLITARLATDYNRELLVVPGSIFSKNSAGTHQFLKLGATPVTSSEDILECLHIETDSTPTTIPIKHLSPQESAVIQLLTEPTHRDALIRLIQLPTNEASQLLMMMELQGHIKSDQNIYRQA
ncbi:DNA-processing protein DprA [Candidatus Kaiserbacteria bacterium]|nr:DNA-processing protein DprA [Candidatus Kaiserbacteria bacterium]